MRSMPDFADLLRVAWRRKTALALGMLLGLALGTLYELQCPPVYRSEAQVLVTKKRPEAVTADGRNMSPIEDYATTHRILSVLSASVHEDFCGGGYRGLSTR
jgi:uncharacterized protein involved in exopolysaccharide biosynthesis